MTILDEILAHKREEVARAKRELPPDLLADRAAGCDRSPLGFRAALQAEPGISVIAEVKRRSPSKGLIRADFDPVWIASCYAESGATCISVLTDERYFGGGLGDLRAVRATVDRPLLRKDFVVDRYQIDEARVAGADAILLIVAALGDEELKEFYAHARARALDVLVEVHDEGELERARVLGANLIGVNNRNLKSFAVDLATTERLAARLDDPSVVLVAESGIADAADVARLARVGAKGFLVGESLMREPHPGKALEALRRTS